MVMIKTNNVETITNRGDNSNNISNSNNNNNNRDSKIMIIHGLLGSWIVIEK